MKIIVFGANGMLGNYVKKYLKQYYEVLSFERKDIDLATITRDSLFKFLDCYVSADDIIINCVGVIKQREYKINDMITVNSIFPNLLAEYKVGHKCNIIHVTTDCIYSGLIGNYDENSVSDCYDDYGKTKFLGENKELTIIRTSIIGEEIYNKKSLLEWVKSNKGKEINGYTNHLWNGVTCLEFAKLIYTIIDKNKYWNGVRHIFSPQYVSKFELINMINIEYNLDIIINKTESNQHCYRHLNTIYENPITTSLENQIKELVKFNYNMERV